MEAKELKEYIFEDEDRLLKVLETVGFHDIWRSSAREIRCAVPEGENRTAVSIRLEPELFTTIYSPSNNYSGDILGAIQEVRGEGFRDVMLYIHAILGLSSNGKRSQKIDPLAKLKMLAGGKRKKRSSKENVMHDKSYLDRFVMLLHKNVIEEGISPKVAKMFNVCYDPEQSRIIFPHYDWIQCDKIVGIKGRTTYSSDIAKDLDIPKYWNYINGYQKTNNLYGFNLSKENLEESKMLILFEAEKSVMKQFTFERGKGFSVALGGHTISDEQVAFILKHTPADCEIVIAFDKDVMIDFEKENGEKYDGEEYLKEEAKKFSSFRNSSYIFDKHDILEEKSAPIDEGYKKWCYLLKWRIGV